jgi:rubredoxin
MDFICSACGYTYWVENYEPDYERVMDLLPEDFTCPACGMPRSAFEPAEDKQ